MTYMFRATRYSAPSLARITASKKKNQKKKKKKKKQQQRLKL